MPRTPLRCAAAVAAAVVALPMMAPLACAVPDDANISEADKSRMAQLDASRTRGMAEAMLGEIGAERAVVADLFGRGTEPVSTLPDGYYRCRTIKMGGISPLVVYGYFDCVVSGNGTAIEKTSGSQRFAGTLSPADDAVFYRGAQHYNDDPVRAYGEDAEFNQVGCIYRVLGTDRYRLELPYPMFESTFDIIELEPAS